MTKTCKNVLLAVVLAVLFAAFTCLLVACVDPELPTTYTVTVKAGTEPANGVTVKFLKGNSTVGTKTTDANGKAEIELAADEYTVELDNLPELFAVPQNANLKLTAENTSLTVTLEKAFTYTVKLVDKNGQPFYAQGVSVGVCTLAGQCLEAVDLGTNGVTVIPAAAGDYHVKVYNLPASAIIPVDSNGYYAGEDFSATKTEMTITVSEILNINSLTANKDADTEQISYHVSKQVAAGEVADFSFTAEFTGEYAITKSGASRWLQNGNSFVEGKIGNTLSQLPIWEKGKTYYFKAVNDGETTATVELTITVPFSTKLNHEGQGAVLDVTVGKANTNARITFFPTVAGEFKVTVTGAPAGIAIVPATESDKFTETLPVISDCSENAAKTFIVNSSKVGLDVLIAITAQADNYPVDLHVTIEKTGNVVDGKVIKTVTETLTQFADAEEGKELVGVPMAAETELVEKDGLFYYNDKLVVVKITEPLESNRFASEAILAYMELTDTRLATYQVITNVDNTETTVDWSFFIRGFDVNGYDFGKFGNLVIPETIETQVYYAKFVNSDGVYPLTAELKEFLEEFYNVNSEAFLWQVPEDADLEKAWMFPLYVYDKATEADVIVGEYKFVKYVNYIADPVETITIGSDKVIGYDDENNENIMGKVGDDEYKLIVNKNGTWEIFKLFNEDYDPETSGTWTKDEQGNYTFTDSVWYIDYVVTFNAEAGTIKLLCEGDSEWQFVKAVAEEQD